MAENTPVITIPVDSEQLKEALSLIDRLNAAAEKYNSKYGPVPGAGGPSPAGAGNGGQGGHSGNPRGSGAGKNEDDQFLNNVNKLASSINKGFGEVNKTIGKTIGMLKGLFESALKWSVRIALIGGGSLFGYDMLTRRSAQQAMTAQGMNIPTGQMQAAQNVYGSRISGVSGIMSGLAAAQQDVTNPAYRGLLAAGIDPTRGAGENLPQLIQRVAEMTRGMKDSGLAYTTISSQGLGSLVSPERLNQIMELDRRGEIPGLRNQYEATSKQLAMPEEVNSSFQKLITVFDTNSDRMENSFKTWVSNLNVPIGELTTTFTDAVESFLSGPNGKAVFDTLKDGVETFSAWISNPDFQSDLEGFTRAVGDITKAIGRATIKIAEWVGDNPGGKADPATIRGAASDPSNPWSISSVGNWVGSLGKSNGKWARDYLRRNANLELKWWQFPDEMNNEPSANSQNGATEPVQHAQRGRRPASWNNYSQLENKYGLKPNFLSAIEQLESGGNPLAVGPMTKKGQAKGAFQFMDATARDMGLRGGEVFDRDKAAEAAAKYFAWLSNKYDGDPLMMAAAYNWGTGNLDKYGLARMPGETRKYLEKFLPQIGASGQLARIQTPNTEGRSLTGGQQSRVVIDVALSQAPGSDINAQLYSNMSPPIIIPF